MRMVCTGSGRKRSGRMSDTREHYEGEVSRLRGIAKTVNPLRVQISQLGGTIRIKEMRIKELEKRLADSKEMVGILHREVTEGLRDGRPPF